MAYEHRHDGLAVIRLVDPWSRGCNAVYHDHRKLLWRGFGNLLVERVRFVGVLRAPRNAATVDLRTHRIELVLDIGEHTEVAAAAAQSPEEVCILIGAGAHELPF